MRFPFLILSIVCLYFVASCRNDFEFEPSTQALTFSKSVVYLDTVFTNIGSSTYTLKVYNPSDKNILLKSVKLAKGLNSKFRMTVDGMAGNNRLFENVEMLAKDSMYIFIEVTSDVADANPTDFLYDDKIEFHHFGGLETQTVNVVTLIQDAIFIRPNRTWDNTTSQYIYELLNLSDSPTEIRGYELTDSELNWTSAKPYVVYDWVKIPNNKTLNIGAGTRVHFHKNSGMIIDKLATLNINGALSTYDAEGQIVQNNYVNFLGDRLEHTYYNIPGQWGGILNFSNQNNLINYLKIKNATIGLYMRPLDLNDSYKTKTTITNSEIYNCTQYGIFALRGELTAQNLVIDDCGLYSFAGIIGGKYNFTHCTLHNRWNSPNQLSVYLSNGLTTNTTLYLSDLEEANFNNSIIYGNNRVQFFAKDESVATGSALLNFKFNNCLIKFDASSNQTLASNPLFYFTTDAARYINCSIANNSSIFKPKFKLTRYHPFDLLEAYSIPNDNSFSTAPDILGRPRTGQINVGAYQFSN